MAIEPDLARIKELGTDIIWFMPIHPIGVDGKKGSLGLPDRDACDVGAVCGWLPLRCGELCAGAVLEAGAGSGCKSEAGQKDGIRKFAEALNRQEIIYPGNYNKLRYVENHDVPRLRSLVKNPEQADAWLAFMFFQKGTAFIYAGQETSDTNPPSLFEIDRVDWSGRDISSQIRQLADLKKTEFPAEGLFKCRVAEGTEGTVVASYNIKGKIAMTGIFPLKGESGLISVDLQDGLYIDVLTGNQVIVVNKQVQIGNTAVILK